MSQLKSNRPKNYQSIKEVVAFLKGFKPGNRFRLSSIDGHYSATFVRYEKKILYYTVNTSNLTINSDKIKKVALHRIKFIMYY